MSGVPVLRLGRQPASDRFSSILVAWKDTPQARRSLHDALPILRRADTVGVVGVGDEVSMERLDAVATHLHRHKIKAKHWHIPDTAGDVCSSLLAHAQNEGAQLIVAGVFGRGHLTERVLGGVTTNMLKNSELSWFMAH
jgi:nucleotide-binding universal stress UspA family protein